MTGERCQPVQWDDFDRQRHPLPAAQPKTDQKKEGVSGEFLPLIFFPS